MSLINLLLMLQVMYEKNRQELLELAKNLLEREEAELPVISQVIILHSIN